MDWDWLKSVSPNVKRAIQRHEITVNWQKASPAVFIIAFLAAAALLIAG